MHCFTQLGFLADVYLDDFYGADSPARASTAFTSLKQLLQELSLQTSPDKDSTPSTKMVCLGIDVDSEEMSLSSLSSVCRNSCRNCLSGPSARVTQRSSCSHYWENFHSSLLASNQGEFSWPVC